MKRKLLFICLSFVCLAQANAQSNEEWDSLFNQGKKYYKSGDSDSALIYFDSAFAVAELLYTENDKQLGINAYYLGRLYDDLGKFEQAERMMLLDLKVTSKTVGNTHTNYGTSLANLAFLYESTGGYEKALPLYDQALEIQRKNLGTKHSSYGIRLSNLASLHKAMGNYDKALSLYLKALDVVEKSLGQDDKIYGAIQNNLADLHSRRGEYEQALELALLSCENAKKNFGERDLVYGYRLNNLAELYRLLGEFEKALPLYKEAISLTKEKVGTEHPNYGILLNNLARLYESLGQYKLALPLYLEALENVEKSVGKDHADYGVNLSNLGWLHKSMGRYNTALNLLLEALENTEKSLGKNHSYYGVRLNYIAELYHSQGLYSEALPYYLSAIENAQNSLGKEHSNYGEFVNNLAKLYVSMGQTKKALPLLSEANENLLNHIESIFGFRSEAERKAYLLTLSQRFEVNQSLGFKLDIEEDSLLRMNLNNQLILKGVLLNSGRNVQSDLLGLEDSMLNNTIFQLRKEKNRHIQQLALTPNRRTVNTDSLGEAINKTEAMLIKEHAHRFGGDIHLNRDWKDVKGQLLQDQVAIEFSHFHYWNNGRATDSVLYVAYLIKKDWDSPKLIYLFEEQELQSVVKLGSPNVLYKNRGARVTNMGLAPANALYQKIWSKIEAELRGEKTIFYAPDGLLHQIPFAALGDSNGLLANRYNLIQLSSTYKLSEGMTEPGRTNFSLWGGITYDFDTTKQTKHREFATASSLRNRSQGEKGAWLALPGAMQEIDSLGHLLNSRNISFSLSSSDSAKEEKFKNLSGKSPTLIHLATHGFFFEKPENQLRVGVRNEYRVSMEPLLRSGLILAGANYAWNKGFNPYTQEDGILSALEISNMDLSNTEMVVLSACETGLGDIDGSEGVYGLQRAFKMAGVDVIIMSLWQVPDKETTEFMQIFYGKWLGGEKVREAFNETQREMQLKYSEEPEKWAAYELFE